MHKFGGPFVFISTHAPLARRDCRHIRIHLHSLYFYSRASCEARQILRTLKPAIRRFLLTRLLRGATDRPEWSLDSNGISTHAPLARRDPRNFRGHTLNTKISTHAPLARRDVVKIDSLSYLEYFYSRASCEARPNYIISCPSISNFYSRASCEARPLLLMIFLLILIFLLTRLLRGATY